MTDPQDSIVRPADPARPVNMTRRKLFRGAAAGTGVLLSVQAKTALGGDFCQSPSAMLSGNTSRPPADNSTCSGGRSPGFWRQPQHFGNWIAPDAIPPTFKPGVEPSPCLSGLGQLSISDIAVGKQGTLFSTVFEAGEPKFKNGTTYSEPVGLWAVLAFHNDFAQGTLLFHLAAAYLNAIYFTGTSAKYPMTVGEVKRMGQAVLLGDTYCPSSLLLQPSCPGGGMTAEEVVKYLEAMYDFNSPIENLCNANSGNGNGRP